MSTNTGPDYVHVPEKDSETPSVKGRKTFNVVGQQIN